MKVSLTLGLVTSAMVTPAVGTAAGVPGCPLSTTPELASFQQTIGSIDSEQEVLTSRINAAKTRIGAVKAKIATAKKIASSLITAKETVDKADTIITVFKPLPIVGGPAKAADVALGVIRPPLNTAYNPAKTAKPKLEAAESALEQAENRMDQALEALSRLETTVGYADDVVCYGDNCATRSALVSLVNLATPPASTAAQVLTQANDTLDDVEGWLDTAEGYLSGVSDALRQQVDDVLGAVTALLSPLASMYDLLDVKLCMPFPLDSVCFSVIDILNGVQALIGAVESLFDPFIHLLYDAIDSVLNLPDFPNVGSIINLSGLPSFPSISLNIYIPFVSYPTTCDLANLLGDCVPVALRRDMGCAYCGDGTCTSPETCSTCPSDCGACQPCHGLGSSCSSSSECCSSAPYCVRCDWGNYCYTSNRNHPC